MNARFLRQITSIERTLIVSILALATLLIAGGSSPASAQEGGVVSGVVTNGTTGQPAGGVEVTLFQFADQSGQNSVDTSVTTDADGAYRFEGLDTRDGLAYAVSTRYQGVVYSSSSMLLLSREPELTADLTVYETTTDQELVSVATRGIIVSGVDPETGTLALTDAYTFTIEGNRTLVEGNDGYSVRFPVPANVESITPRPGFNFGSARIEEAAVLATGPLRPSAPNASLDYEVRYTGQQMTVDVMAAYPTRTVQILIPTDLIDDEIRIDAEGAPLIDGGVVPIGERDYHIWTASDLDANTTMTLRISGLPSPPEADSLSTIEPAVVAFGALAIASIVTGWLVWRRGLHRQRPVVLAPAAAAPLKLRREQLADELRSLEEAASEGTIDRETYSSTRLSILSELRRISRQYRGLGDDE